jgi:hypothetical protein
MAIIINVVVAAVTIVVAARAALQNLTPQRLDKYSDHLFTGTIDQIEYKDIPNKQFPEEWVTRHFRLTVTVRDVLKTVKHSKEHPDADDETVAPGSKVHVMMWKGIKRLEGFTGDTGTALLPVEFDKRDPALHDGVYGFYSLYIHREQGRRGMFHESFPHDAEQHADVKAYIVLNPNGFTLDGTKLAAKEDL